MYEDTLTNSLIIGGKFAVVNGDTAFGMVKWNGSSFERMGCGFRSNCYSSIAPSQTNDPPFSFVRYGDYVYATGLFYGAGGQLANSLARFNSSLNNWEPFGSGLFDTETSTGVGWNLRVIGSELYVCGSFFYCDGVQANSLIKYDGENWHTVYDFPVYPINNIANVVKDVALYKNEIYVGGLFYDGNNFEGDIWNIARYNGSDWVSVGGGIKGGMAGIENLIVYKNKLYVSGVMSKAAGNPGNGIAAWDGEQWDDVGGGLTYASPSNIHVRDMKVYKDKLYVTGIFSFAGDISARFVASWDGEKWCSLDTGPETFCGNPLGSAIGFLNDTLFVGGNNCLIVGDSLIGGRMMKRPLNNTVETECSTPVSVQEPIVFENEILIYPNPSNGEFLIRLPENFTGIGRVFHYTGQLVSDFRITERTHTLNFSDKAKGMYFIQLIDTKKQESKTYKVILQ